MTKYRFFFQIPLFFVFLLPAGLDAKEQIRAPEKVSAINDKDTIVRASKTSGQLTLAENSLKIMTGYVLTIDQGVNVEFVPRPNQDYDATIEVAGTLIVNGSADQPSMIRGYAGMLQIVVTGHGSLKLTRTILKDMRIRVLNGSLTIDDCILENCSIQYDGSNASKDISIKNSLITKNLVAPAIAIIRCEDAPKITIENCVIKDNTQGGLIISSMHAKASKRPETLISKCDIYNNGPFNVSLTDSKDITLQEIGIGETTEEEWQKTVQLHKMDDRKPSVILVNAKTQSVAKGASDIKHPAMNKRPEGLMASIDKSWTESDKPKEPSAIPNDDIINIDGEDIPLVID
ncbi:MAG: right-handed parallel beta-helix repeat-containing protein [Planctomycetota bacterium]